MLQCDATQCRIAGEITVASATTFLTEVKPYIEQKIPLLDFSGVTDVDSTVLAFILSCMRYAQQQNYSLRFSGFPSSVTTLAELYDIAPLLQA
jgi:ABC-type transporter Mla MlaB component